MDQCLLAVTRDRAAKGSAKDQEVANVSPVHCYCSFPPSFLTVCGSKHCLLKKFALVIIIVIECRGQFLGV